VPSFYQPVWYFCVEEPVTVAAVSASLAKIISKKNMEAYVKYAMMFELAAPIKFSVLQIIANRNCYIPVVGGGEAGVIRCAVCKIGVLGNIWR
jgi:hypothetical protein